MIPVEGTTSELPQRTKNEDGNAGFKDMKESDLRNYIIVTLLLSSPQSPPIPLWPPPSIVASPWRSSMRSSEPRMMTTTWPGSPSTAPTRSLMSHMFPQFLAPRLCPPSPPLPPSLPTHPHPPSLILLSTPNPAMTTLISTRTRMSIPSPSHSTYPQQRSIHPRAHL